MSNLNTYMKNNDGVDITPQEVDCSICLIPRSEWGPSCMRCKKRVCLDCYNLCLSTHNDYPLIVYSCGLCRAKRTVDDVCFEEVDYRTLSKATLAKICLLYRKKLMGEYESSDED